MVKAVPSCQKGLCGEFRRMTGSAILLTQTFFSGARFLGGGLCVFFWGLFTDYWADGGVTYYGLWYYCSPRCEKHPPAITQDWIFLTRAMEETASLLYATAVLTLVRRMYWGATYDLTHVLGPVGCLDILIVLGAVFSLSGGCYFYFSISYPHSVSWSWMAAELGSLSALTGLVTCRTDQCLQLLEYLRRTSGPS